MSSSVFTQWECEVAIYRANAAGTVDGETPEPEWMGGCDNRMQIEQGYAEERADISGIATPRFRHLEEDHSIELERLWLTQVKLTADGSRSAVTPRIPRNQTYVVVLLWTDEEEGVWHKRSYFAATINPLSVNSGSEFFELRVPIRSGSCYFRSGLLAATVPDLYPSRAGVVRYVDELGAVDLYEYDFNTEEFTALEDHLGRIEFPGAGGGYQFRILVDGDLALAVAGGQVRVKSLVAIGGSFVNALPRLEFHNGSTRFASLSSAGQLGIPAFDETIANPDLEDDFQFRSGGTWLASVGPSALHAPSIADTL